MRSIFTKLNFNYKPLIKTQNEWNYEFKSGRWKYLESIEEQARYSIILGYLEFFFDGTATLLDLGCGQGALFDSIRNCKYSYYLGIDISDEAIHQASTKINTKSRFICTSIETYQPEQIFDLIVFNESLYYLSDPISILLKYNKHLSDNGLIVVSMWDNKKRNNRLWKNIDKLYNTIDYTTVENCQKKLKWHIKLLSIAK